MICTLHVFVWLAIEIGRLYFCQTEEISKARTCYPMYFVSKKCCLIGLAFGFMALERADESMLCPFWIFHFLWLATSGGGSQHLASHLGRKSLHDYDSAVVARAGVREST
jgi:hypothetical protein